MMRSSASFFLATWLLALLHVAQRTSAAPVPIPKELDNTIEEEDGLLVLVPTVPVDGKGQPTKREIDYEIISIPGELIRRTVRQVTEAHGLGSHPSATENTAGSIFISDLTSDASDEIIVNTGSSYGSSSSGGIGNLNVLSTTDLSKILSSVASAGLSAASTGANIAGQAKDVLTTATRVGTSAVVGGTQAVRWALQQKATGIRSFAEFAGTGLHYAGRLTSAVLKVLLKIPGIKARVISDLIQAGQPLATALSDVISGSADDLGDIFSAQTNIFRDAINILFKLIQDVLSLKGRILASFGASGLDKGANLVTAGVKVGSAFVQTAGDVVSAVGRGVGDLVQVVSQSNLPKPPALPTIRFPVLPQITYPESGESYGAPPSDSYKSPSPSNSYSSKGISVTTYS